MRERETEGAERDSRKGITERNLDAVIAWRNHGGGNLPTEPPAVGPVAAPLSRGTAALIPRTARTPHGGLISRRGLEI